MLELTYVELMRNWMAAIAASVVVLGCGVESDVPEAPFDDIGTSEQEILNGAAGGPSSVGHLMWTNPAGQAMQCSATLVGPTTAVTARHCVDDGGSGHAVVFDPQGHYTYGPIQYYGTVVGIVPHPSKDIALLHLSLTQTPTPTPISLVAPTAGMALDMVGFGHVSPNTPSTTRRHAPESINYVWSSSFYYYWNGSGAAMPGDSGGAALATVSGFPSLVGVPYYLYAYNNYSYGYNFMMRVDTEAGWIRSNALGRVHFTQNQNVNLPKDVDLSGSVNGNDFLLMLMFYGLHGNVSFPLPNSTGLLYDVDGNFGLSINDVTPYGHQNILSTCDVNADGNISPIDSLIVMNNLNAGHGGTLPANNTLGAFTDVSGDGVLSPLDALRVINYLNGVTSGCSFFIGPLPPLP